MEYVLELMDQSTKSTAWQSSDGRLARLEIHSQVMLRVGDTRVGLSGRITIASAATNILMALIPTPNLDTSPH